MPSDPVTPPEPRPDTMRAALEDIAGLCRTTVEPGRTVLEVAYRADAALATPAGPEPGLDSVLAKLSDDDMMYDHPIAPSGEPMDPVLFVRWDALRAALASPGEGPLDREDGS